MEYRDVEQSVRATMEARPMKGNRQLIGGRWMAAANGGTWGLVNPATGQVIDTVPYGDGSDAAAAIEAASTAFDEWRDLGAKARGMILERAASLIDERAESYGVITTEESGKPLAQSIAEWRSAPSYLRFAAEEAARITGRIIPTSDDERRIDVSYSPIGVVGVIAAWNFPVYNINRAVSSALATGCTVVARPSEFTPRSAFLYAEALADAGIPPGVLNVINGSPPEMAAAMLDDPAVRKIQFTGSSRVGKLLMDGASRTVTKLSLELGGNAPVIVMPDIADLADVVRGAVHAKYRNNGQVCISPQRFLVHASIADTFAKVASDLSAALRVGDPMAADTDIGPLINETQRDRVAAIVDASVAAGARPLTGASRLAHTGFFYSPTVLSGAQPGTPALTEEIFGPVLPVIPFENLDDAIAIANSVEHGLASFVWTSNLDIAMEASDRLEYGMVGVNDWYPVTAEAPFGGVKQSGVGRESGTEGILEYLEPKTRYIRGL
jgi:succinate-semialdehyde dehydrogenase / glutarate-semialdehyde dehydrogenase